MRDEDMFQNHEKVIHSIAYVQVRESFTINVDIDQSINLNKMVSIYRRPRVTSVKLQLKDCDKCFEIRSMILRNHVFRDQ